MKNKVESDIEHSIESVLRSLERQYPTSEYKKTVKNGRFGHLIIPLDKKAPGNQSLFSKNKQRSIRKQLANGIEPIFLNIIFSFYGKFYILFWENYSLKSNIKVYFEANSEKEAELSKKLQSILNFQELKCKECSESNLEEMEVFFPGARRLLNA